jgi:hypothetical protein
VVIPTISIFSGKFKAYNIAKASSKSVPKSVSINILTGKFFSGISTKETFDGLIELNLFNSLGGEISYFSE